MTQVVTAGRSVRHHEAVRVHDAVRQWARTQPDAPACTYLAYDRSAQGEAQILTYADLDARAHALAAVLRERARSGDRVAILLPQGPEYVVAFLGCLYSGLLAVPLFAPDLRRPNDRIAAALDDARPAVTLTLGDHRDRLATTLPGVDCGAVLAIDDLPAAGVAGSAPFVDDQPSEPNAVAYLQYTSGSTRRPAGVMVTHANLAVNCLQLRGAFGVGDTGPVVSWLPFFHDMGLLFGIAAPLQAGGHAVHLSPFAFVQRPVRWLRLLTEHRATVTASPNFGLNLAVHKVPDSAREDVDLSALQCLVNGAEPIRAATLDDFTRVYRHHGFDPGAHRPGYGLAEATLMVSASLPRSTPLVSRFDRTALTAGIVEEVNDPTASGYADATVLVGCGVPWQQHVRVVDPNSHTDLGTMRVGEIWVRGPNVCRGYFERPEDSRGVFAAELSTEEHPSPEASTETVPSAPSDGYPVPGATTGPVNAEWAMFDLTTPGASAGSPVSSRGWLRTGDIGFLHDGVLFLTSRLKDLVIINGRNHYPADVEATAERAVPVARVGHVAAFAVDVPDGEAMVLVVEVEAAHVRRFDPDAALRQVRAALGRTHEIEPHDVIFTRPGAIPKTTSGKLQRQACRQRYLAGELNRLVNPHGATDGN